MNIEEEAESAQQIRKSYEEFQNPNDFEEKATDFDENLKEKSEFDEQRYNVDSSNINSPVKKMEIHFNSDKCEK